MNYPYLNFRKYLLAGALFASCCTMLYAQEQTQSANTPMRHVYKLKYVPAGMDNYQFAFFYYNGSKVYNLRNFMVASVKPIKQLGVNPADGTYSVIEEGKKSNSLRMFDSWQENAQLRKFDCFKYSPQAFCYSSDARNVFVYGSDGQIHVFNMKENFETAAYACAVAANRMKVSPNGYFLAVAGGNEVEVMAVESRTRRALCRMEGKVNDVDFSADGKWMAVLADNGVCKIYDTRTFELVHTYDAMGIAALCAFHPESKYLAVVTGEKRIALINLLNNSDRRYMDVSAEGVKTLKFLRDTQDILYVVYNTASSLELEPIIPLSPNRQARLREELDSRMAEWVKRMDGESLEDYNARVNEDTRMKQLLLFETEIATGMAEASLDELTPKVGNYNADMGMLTIELDNMSNIYLSVPSNELEDFMEEGVLKMTNSRYCLNEADEFELVYTEVVNTRTGKKYVFDNTERKSLAYLENDDNFVPLSQLQLSQMEENRLEEIRNDIMEAAKNQNVITDHTHIDVKTRVLKETDATGRRVTNYEIGVSYTVDADFSSRDDYPSGHFKCEESNAAKAMLAVMKKALENDMAKYVVAGKTLKVHITGMADATPFVNTVSYDGSYGDYEREPVTKDGNLSAVTVTRETGISENDQLAFLRAMGVKHYMMENIPSLQTMDTRYDASVNVSDKAGSEYRRIGVTLTFVDAF